MANYAQALEFCVEHDYAEDEFIEYCKRQGLPVEQENLHRRLFARLRTLADESRNGIWARVIKNAFAPLFVGRVDIVVGNPPWVNWEHLPEDYRDSMKHLWVDYGLFSLSPTDGSLGGGKKDLAMLFVYIASDHYLRKGGRLTFVITESVFKSSKAGDGFRKFSFSNTGGTVFIAPEIVDDFSDINVFEGASSPTALLSAVRQDRPFDYPIPYLKWSGPATIPQHWELSKVMQETERIDLEAAPVAPSKRSSSWLTAPPGALPAMLKAIGRSPYRPMAHEGINPGGLVGGFFLRIEKQLANGDVLATNLGNAGKRKVPEHHPVLESDLIFPLVRGRDVSRWQVNPSAYILVSQDPQSRSPISAGEMRRLYPKTLDYLSSIEEHLKLRKSKHIRKQMEDGAFWAMFGVGDYTFAPWKVFWRQMLPELRMAVLGPCHDEHLGDTVPVTQHVVTFIAAEGADEAHFICACGNARVATMINACYSTGKSFGTPQLLDHLAIPRFDPSDEIHTKLVGLSKQCHSAAAENDSAAVVGLEEQIDEVACDLWEITQGELRSLMRASKAL